MNIHEYLSESKRTVSDKFFANVISPQDALHKLALFERDVEYLDRIKKGLFYGKPLPIDPPPEVADVGTHFDQEELHWILGIITEAAELSKALRAHWENPSEETRNKVIDESFDIEWYQAGLWRTLGVDPEVGFDGNIAKLRARFPEKFETEQALIRDTNKEDLALTSVLKSK